MTRNKSIIIKISEDEKTLIAQYADAAGTTISDYMRTQGLHPAETPKGRQIQEILRELCHLAELTNQVKDNALRKAFVETEEAIWQCIK